MKPRYAEAPYEPLDHDHVGFMVFTDDAAECSECGQTWRMGQRGWTPIDPRRDRWKR